MRLDRFRGAWTLLGQCLDTCLDTLGLVFWLAQKLLGGCWGATEVREKLCWMLLGWCWGVTGVREKLCCMLFLAFFVVNKFKEKTHASLIQSGMSFSLNLFMAVLPRVRASVLGASLEERYRGPFLVFARLACWAVLLELRTGKPPRSPRLARLALRPVPLQLKTPWTVDVIGVGAR